MKSEVSIRWTGNMAFESEVNGHKLVLDAAKEFGGEDLGYRPKPLVMAALAGCTGMDVVSILKKMRVEYDGLEIKVEGDVADEHPKTYTALKLIYEFKGKDLPMEKLKKAVALSEETYCGVWAMYKKAVPVTYEIRVVE